MSFEAIDNEELDTPTSSEMSYDFLAHFVERVELAVAAQEYVEAERLIDANAAAAWFGFRTDRFYAIVSLLLAELPAPGKFLSAVHSVMSNPDPQQVFRHLQAGGSLVEDPKWQYFFRIFLLGAFRSAGLHKKAVEQGEAIREHQGSLVSVFDRHGGWALTASVQLGISAMLAGDFDRAIAAFTEAQFHVKVPAFAFLTRDALVKSALIHASFGDPYQAKIMLARAEQIPRTASWAEDQIDVHRDFTAIMLEGGESSIEALKNIQLHDVGEMWPFYVVAIHHLLGSAGYRDEAEYQLGMFETLRLPITKGHGFSGSVVPLKRALLAMSAGRGSEAQEFISQADPDILYTQLISAASHLYAGRPKEALSRANQLYSKTAGLRLLDIRRLAIVAAANYASGNTQDALSALEQAANFPRGLTVFEVQLFSPETRRLAEKWVVQWPEAATILSTFLTRLPTPGAALSERELVILREVSLGHTRSEIAKNLFITLNTVKSQLQSVYRKLGVSSGPSAVQEAERRGLL